MVTKRRRNKNDDDNNHIYYYNYYYIIGTCHNTEKCGIKLSVFYFMMLLVSWITQWQSWGNQGLTQALNCRNGVLQLTSEPDTCQIQVRSITTWPTTFSSYVVVIINPTVGVIDPGICLSGWRKTMTILPETCSQCQHCGCRSSELLQYTAGYRFSVLRGNDSLILEVKGGMCLWNIGNQ